MQSEPKIDRFSALGIGLGLIAVLGTQWIDGGHMAALLQGPAALIVGFGTLGATLLSCSRAELARAFIALRTVFQPPHDRTRMLPAFYRDLAFIARKDGLVALEDDQFRSASAFAERALRHLVDGCDESQLREILEADRAVRRRDALDGAQVFELAGGYAPTMGILGAVLGLIRAMESLADPESLGQGIAVAFIATIYGVGVANLVLLPAAEKIRGRAREADLEESMVIEGTLDLQKGTGPRMIERRLEAFLASEATA